MPSEPSPRSDPEGYLSLRKFSRRLAKCPRTGLPISFADIGDPEGVPVLHLLPSGCSRWLSVAQDPLAKRYGIRLIAVDRPGMGAVPMVPLKVRIRLSCEMMISVLEYLDVKLAHMIVSSGGIYYALHLLNHHPDIFVTGLKPPPSLYLVAPWAPLLPSDHPEYYSSAFTWIPDKLIETQHLTLPHVLKAANGAYSFWTTSTEAVESGWNFAKSLWSGETPATSAPVIQASTASQPTAMTDLTVPLEDDDEEEEEDLEAIERHPWKSFSRLWGHFPEIFTDTISDYLNAENHGGVGQEHLQCLNRGTEDTGPKWLEGSLDDLASALAMAQGASENASSKTNGLPIPDPINVHVWWGWEDAMVPRQGQLWFNRVILSHPKEIRTTIHDVPDGDHGDLMMRREAIGQVYSMIRRQGRATKS